MCKVLKVDRSSYYHWVRNGCKVQKIDEKLKELIKIIFLQSRQTYGIRQIKEQLVKKYGVIVSKRKIRNILKHLGLSVK
jgi:transposase